MGIHIQLSLSSLTFVQCFIARESHINPLQGKSVCKLKRDDVIIKIVTIQTCHKYLVLVCQCPQIARVMAKTKA